MSAYIGTVSVKYACPTYKGPSGSYGQLGMAGTGVNYNVFYESNGYYCLGRNSSGSDSVWLKKSDCKELVPMKTVTTPTTKKSVPTTKNTQTTQAPPVTPPMPEQQIPTMDDLQNAETAETLANAAKIQQKIIKMVQNRDQQITDLTKDASMRLFGLPHQLLAHNDHRLSDTSKLGRMFTQTFILDAPIIYLKPGASEYLPGMSKAEKEAFTGIFASFANDTNKDAAQQIAELATGDDLRYFDFTQRVSEYMSAVNMLCRIGSVFLNINKKVVPWLNSGNATYGTYDWRMYTFGNQFNNVLQAFSDVRIPYDPLSAFKEAVAQMWDNLANDDMYIQFYVDANASFSESASNSTSQSMLNSLTDQLSEFGKELQFVSGVTNLDFAGLTGDMATSFDEAVSSVANGNGALATFLTRLTGNASQLLTGSNFLAPDIWSGSDYGKSYSFTLSLATPYGTKESWYLNIYVPLMHIIAMGLPVQTSANTYASPYLVKAYAPGWFSCDLGIIDSISIDKGGDGSAWSSCGLPNEIKVSVSIKDLYSNLALPNGFSIKNFFNNTGLIHFMMTNCGVDITKSGLEDKLGVFANLFANTISDIVDETTYGIWYNLESRVRNIISF